jgi:hypothetical protein
MKTHSTLIPCVLRALASPRSWTVESFLLRSLGDHTVTIDGVVGHGEPSFCEEACESKNRPQLEPISNFLPRTMYKT